MKKLSDNKVPHKQITETIVAVEQSYDVNSILFDDIMVWPFMRLILSQQLFHRDKNFLKLEPNQDYGIHYLSSLSTKELELLNTHKDTDIFFFSTHVTLDRQEKMDGKYFHPYFDPIIDLCKGQLYSTIKCELFSNQSKKYLPRYHSPIFLSPSVENKKADLSVKIRHFDLFNEVIQDITGFSVDEEYILISMQSLSLWQKYFIEILRIISPKIAFLVCFEYKTAMAFISACRKLGILTVDIQHGVNANYHPLYTHWTKIPSKGYSLVPNFFWCWGNTTKNSINNWNLTGSKYHEAIVGGNQRYHHFLNSDNDKTTLNTGINQFYESINKSDKVILYALQGTVEFSDIVLEAMIHSPKKWLWLIRMHPSHIDKNKKQELNNHLAKLKINFDIDYSTSISLFSLLKRSHHHITAYSATCYDAIAFRVPTTFVDPSGKELFGQDIDAGIFSYATNWKELMNTIINNTMNPSIGRLTNYVETSQEKAIEALKIIFERYDTIVNNAKILNELGESLFAMKLYQSALCTFQRAVNCFPKFAISYSNMGVIYWKMGDTKKAQGFFSHAYRLDPDEKKIVYNYVQVLIKGQYFQQAIEVINEYLEKNPSDMTINRIKKSVINTESNFGKVS
jgi:tetratricopeptide (TPR) repeat protein